MSAAHDVARMLTLVPWLLERPGASLAEMAAVFGVGQDTLREDLGHLDFCGLPGLGGGDLFEVTMVGDRVVLTMADELRRPVRPTAAEAFRLVVTVDAVAEALGDELPALRRAVDRIRTALRIPERSADVLEPEGVAALPLLRAAVRDGVEVVLTYQGRGDTQPTTRHVDPWALHVVDGTWYLQGHDRDAGDRRVFRLDRIATASRGPGPRSVDPPEELPAPRYVPGPDDLRVVIELSPRGRWVEEAVTADRLVEHDDGSAILELRTDAPRWIASLVVMAAGEAVVTSPRSLRDTVIELARAGL